MPAPSPVTVLLNPAGGNAGQPGTEATIAARFHAVGIDARIITLSREQSPTEAARTATAGAAAVIAAGGDGTVSAVAAGLVGSPTLLGVLPLGTLNHFAKDLHIPLELEAAVSVIAAGRVARIDAGQVNDRVFINNSSIGIYPSVVEIREELRRAGHAKWPAMAIATVRVLRHHHGDRKSVV